MDTRTMQNSTHSRSASSPSNSSSPPSAPDRRLSLRSLSSSIRRGPAPSSLIEPEASSSIIHSLRQDHTTTVSSEQPTPRPASRNPSFTSNSTSRNRLSTVSTRSIYDESRTPWGQRSLAKRLSWTINQTFGGLTPNQINQVEQNRARGATPLEITRPSWFESTEKNDRRISIVSSRPSTARSTASVTPSTSSEATICPDTDNTLNKPFAKRRRSTATAAVRPELDLPAVTEVEEALEENTEEDDMHLRRAFTQRFGRNEPVRKEQKQRPVISLPQLISTTNAQVTDQSSIHPALRNSSSSHGSQVDRYSNSTAPSTPTSESPGLTDSSSVGSSRSSTNSPLEGRLEGMTPVVTPNHLTQYFPAPAPFKEPETIVIATDREPEVEPEIAVTDFAAAPLAPALPQRAPSHSKSEHMRLARSRSLRSSGGYSRASNISAHTSMSSTAEAPFKRELAQLEEVREDFNSLVIEEQSEGDEAVMNNGFRHLTPSVYCLDLSDLEAGRFA